MKTTLSLLFCIYFSIKLQISRILNEIRVKCLNKSLQQQRVFALGTQKPNKNLVKVVYIYIYNFFFHFISFSYKLNSIKVSPLLHVKMERYFLFIRFSKSFIVKSACTLRFTIPHSSEWPTFFIYLSIS